MTLPLPYVIEDEAVQGNFDFLKQQFPLSKKHLTLETPHEVGAAGEPAFQNSWVNYTAVAGFQGVRYWKDSVGLVHVEGLASSGVVGSGTPVFTLPAGYRPVATLLYVTISNGALGRIDITSAGEVRVITGNNTYVSLNLPPFKQEQ